MNVPRSLRAAMLAIAVFCICTHIARGASADRLSVYRQQLQATSAVLERVARQQRRAPKAALPRIQVHVPPAPLGQAPVYSPSLDDWLQSNLAAVRKSKNSKARARRLSALAGSLRALARAPDATAAPSADPKAQALDIVGQRAYQVKGAGPAPPERQSWLSRLWKWIENLIGELFDRVYSGASKIPLLGQIIAVLLLLGVAGALTYAGFVLAARMRRRAWREAGSIGAVLPADVNPDDLYARGLDAAAAGRYAQAITLLFQASLLYFDAAGTVTYDASRTAGEYRRLIRKKAAPASQPFDELAGAFTFVAYADRAPSAQDWSTAQSAFLALRPSVSA